MMLRLDPLVVLAHARCRQAYIAVSEVLSDQRMRLLRGLRVVCQKIPGGLLKRDSAMGRTAGSG